MKKIKPILLIFLMLIIYTYYCSIVYFPNNIILFQGENIKLNTIFGITISQKNYNYGETDTIKYNKKDESTISTTTQNTVQSDFEEDNKTPKIGTSKITLDLFGTIPLKQIDVNIIPKTKVIPLGKSIGLRLYTKGVLVVGMSEIQDQNNNKIKPYENTGIEEGDTILSINRNKIQNTDQLIKSVNNSNGKTIQIEYMKDKTEKIIKTNITPVKTGENEYKIGLWVRDAAEGVGTVTFYEPTTGQFAALGHPITDVDTGDIINISNGELITSKILSVIKGEKGKPGEIRGIISNGLKIGDIIKNTNFGIFGNVSQLINMQIQEESKEIQVALRNEIKEGKAYILCELETGKIEKFEIEIKKIYAGNNYDNKSMLIKISDQNLLEKTGGIVQRNVTEVQ